MKVSLRASYGDIGTHFFKIIIINNEGNYSVTPLTITVVSRAVTKHPDSIPPTTPPPPPLHIANFKWPKLSLSGINSSSGAFTLKLEARVLSNDFLYEETSLHDHE